MSLHSEGLGIPLKVQEATGSGVSVVPRVGMYRICYEILGRFDDSHDTQLGDVDGDTNASLISLREFYYCNPVYV